MNKKRIDEILFETSFDIDEYYILGDASLVLRGIKEECDKLKLCVTQEVADKLKNTYEVKSNKDFQNIILFGSDEVEIYIKSFEQFEREIIQSYSLEKIELVLERLKNTEADYSKIDIEKIEKYIKELKQVICCGAFIIHDEKILLVQHKNGGHWSFPKGHMEEGETQKETAIREVYEETGIVIKIISDKEYKSSYKIDMNTQKTVIYFEGIIVEGAIKKQEEEIINIAWFSFEEAINKLTFKDNKTLLKNFLENRN